MPEGVQWNERGTLDVELEDGLQVAVEVRECDLLGIDSVHFEDFGDRGWLRFSSLGLNFSFGPLGDHVCIECTEKTVWLLDFYLPGELRDEFAQRAELLILIANDLDESIAVSDQTYIHGTTTVKVSGL